jgi:hypothetical protein
MSYGLGIIFDATKRGSNARYINHSCDPNCYVEMWISEGYQPRCIILAKKRIDRLEELTIDYGFGFFGKNQRCHCGSNRCRQFLSPNPSKKSQISRKQQQPLQKDEISIIKTNQAKHVRNEPTASQMIKLRQKSEGTTNPGISSKVPGEISKRSLKSLDSLESTRPYNRQSQPLFSAQLRSQKQDRISPGDTRRRRGPFKDMAKRMETAATCRRGACERCRQQKIRVSVF